MVHRLSLFGIMVIFGVLSSGAQVVDLPLSHEAYEFMDRMEAKGLLIGYKDAIRPLPRSSFAQHLLDLRSKVPGMTSYEQNEYQFLSEEFFQELQLLQPDTINTNDRWSVASFNIAGGRFNVGFNTIFEKRFDGNKTLDKKTYGFQFYGTAFKKMGFYFNSLVTTEKGSLLNASKVHTPEQGIPMFNIPRQYGYEYNENQAGISYDFGPANIAIEQTMNAWGDERYGHLILSTKPPSYPKIKLRSTLTDWLKLTYIHAELHSNVLDSNLSYQSGTSVQSQFYRTVYRSKFYAAQAMEISVWNLFDLTLGESIVYSDRGPLLIYLIPITFFSAAETYNRDTDNAQLFASLEIPLRNGIVITSSFFIDELSKVAIGDSIKGRDQIGFSAGTRVYDLPIENLEIALEYTRINPWVYSHKYAAANYTNNGYTMGHWIGQNADLGTIAFNYRPSRSLNVGLQYQLYRKGDTSDVANQYSPPAEQFLYGRNRIERTLTLSASYQAVRDGFIEAYYRYGSIDDRQRAVPARTMLHEAMIRLRYGLW